MPFCYNLEYTLILLNPYHSHTQRRKEMKITSLLPVHTWDNTKNDHIHTGSCSHRAQYQSKSPFTHRPSNAEGLTCPEKVRDLPCSHNHQLHPLTGRKWSRFKAAVCLPLRTVHSATSPEIPPDLRVCNQIQLKSYFPIVSVLVAMDQVINVWSGFVIIINVMTVIIQTRSSVFSCSYVSKSQW